MKLKHSVKFIKIVMFLGIFLFSVNNSFADDKTVDVNIDQPKNVTITKNEYKVIPSKYIFAPGDTFSLSVYDEPDLKQDEIVVKPDGYATVSPIGEVYVAGQDISAVISNLKDKMKPFLRDPQISINIKSFNPPTIYVYGAVQRPGVYQQFSRPNITGAHPDIRNPYANIFSVIANAGGITSDADLSNVEITSSDNGQKQVVNLWNLLQDGDVSQNILLKANDKVYIPKLKDIIHNDEEFKILASSNLFPETFAVRVIGEVGRPGVFNISSKAPYLNSAIASAEGYNVDAKKTLTFIHRKNPNGSVSKIVVNPEKTDLVLRPDDLIEISAKSYIGPVRFADHLTRFIAPFYSTGTTGNSWADLFKPKRRGTYTTY